jgi:hypothetical protein
LGVVLCTLACVGFVDGAPAGDWQYWNEFITETPITERFKVEGALEQQEVDDMSEFGLYNVTIAPVVDVTGWLSVGAEYKYEREKEDGVWGTEHRYTIRAGVKHEAAGAGLKLTGLVDFRDFESDDQWRWHPKLKIAYPIAVGGLDVVPFLTEEPYYVFAGEGWNQNRSSLGVTFETQTVEISAYHMRVMRKTGDTWPGTHVVGTEVVFKF